MSHAWYGKVGGWTKHPNLGKIKNPVHLSCGNTSAEVSVICSTVVDHGTFDPVLIFNEYHSVRVTFVERILNSNSNGALAIQPDEMRQTTRLGYMMLGRCRDECVGCGVWSLMFVTHIEKVASWPAGQLAKAGPSRGSNTRE